MTEYDAISPTWNRRLIRAAVISRSQFPILLAVVRVHTAMEIRQHVVQEVTNDRCFDNGRDKAEETFVVGAVERSSTFLKRQNVPRFVVTALLTCT